MTRAHRHLSIPALMGAATLILAGCSGTSGSGMFSSGSDVGSVPNEERISDPAVQRAALAAAEQAIASGRMPLAHDMLRRAYEGSPSAATAVRRAQVMRAMGLTREAQAFLVAAETRFPRDLALVTEVARVSLDLGDTEAASRSVQRMLRDRSAGYTQYQVAGAFYARANDATKANEFFGRAEAAASTVTERTSAQANRALLLAQGGDVSGALTQLEALSTSAGASARVYAALAVLRGGNGDLVGAASAARQSGMSPAEIAELRTWLGGAPEPQEVRPRRSRSYPRAG